MRAETRGPPAEGYSPGTLVDLFLEGLDPARPVVARTRGPDGTWAGHSSEELAASVRRIALGLRSLGFEPGERVAILSHTRLEWTHADYGIVMSRLVSVPVYPVLPPDQIQHVLADSGARGVVLSDQEQLEKVLEIIHELPALEHIWVMDEFRASADDRRVSRLSDLMEAGLAAEPELGEGYEEYARATAPDDLATLIYTSGTTGLPKGVMLSHGNFHSNAVLAGDAIPLGRTDTALSLLPLAHVFERLAGNYVLWRLGCTVAYAESPTTVARDLGEVRPTLMAAVPRVYEKVLERAEAAARDAGGAKAGIFDWARRVGELRVEREQAGRPVGAVLRFQARIADRLVFSKLRARTGGRIRFFVSGGAPLPAPVARFFFAAGLPVLEGYGLTETSPVLTFNRIDRFRIGTVGLPIAETEIRLADDGEILARGPQIMQGYFNLPEATAEAIDPEGWFHTGDVGEIDEDGFLRITDRKKDLIITAYGKNIAPQPIENEVKRHPLVGEAVLIGDRRKFPIMITVPDYDAARSMLVGAAGWSDEELFDHEPLHAAIERGVAERCADMARYERPREVLVLPGPFTVEGGELTPTLKVKRRVIVDRYGARIDEIYEEAERELEAEARRRGFDGPATEPG